MLAVSLVMMTVGASRPSDDQLADGAGVVRQGRGRRFVHPGPVVSAGPVQGDGFVVGRGEVVDVADQRGRAHPQGEELDAAGARVRPARAGW